MGIAEVYILGQKYIVKGEASEEHIRKVALYVDEKLKEVYNCQPGITPLKASIIAALNIADELFRVKDEQKELARFIEEKTDTLTALLNPVDSTS